MQNNKLRAPLIKSAVLLAVFSLLVYLTSTSPTGSVWNSLGQIFFGVFRIAQLGIGLILALLFCLMVLVGIFLGSVAMVSRDSAATMYRQLYQMLADRLLFLKKLVKKNDQQQASAAPVPGSVLAAIGARQDRLENGLDALHSRLEQLERDDGRELAARLEHLAAEVAASREADKRAEEKIQALAGQVEEITRQIRESDPGPRLAELAAGLEALAGRLEALPAGSTELDAGGNKDTAAAAANDRGDDEGAAHRLFAYLDDPEDQEKIARLVADTFAKDMTYAQTVDYLVQEMGSAAAAITAHPSLVKDYIRYCRKSGKSK
ncbi:hypothetical protein BMS3Bbin14_01602 [bacterium BMS3Bbin14]|nr:hypothetical protein BMS3Abin13_01233 [bacterium BMS3Abin13]GBE53119.1 hypothetical protein BMS3Bbin14_01602 [bacterium BMS3Bbin14]HDL98673.1 hypothetical protein [Desulfobacteraceae bacterium]